MPGTPRCQDIGTTRCKLVTPSEATLREATGAFPDLPARYPTRGHVIEEFRGVAQIASIAARRDAYDPPARRVGRSNDYLFSI
jgi:hypothetical protein